MFSECKCGLCAPCSTCFDVEVSEDLERAVCAFKHCASKCKENGLWKENTPENIENLALHVAHETHAFVVDAVGDSKKRFAFGELPRTAEHIAKTRAVIFICELDEKKCSLSFWLPQMLTELFCCDADDGGVAIVCRRFRSREELLTNIVLGELHNAVCHSESGKYPPVLVVLSTHASNQGQVFTTTPSQIAGKHGFEEFCSVHDFVVSCQDAVCRHPLVGIYMSACYVMRLDKSHESWPVDIKWLKKTLKTDIVGPCNEVYYTGSQTCDFFFLASFIALAQGVHKKLKWWKYFLRNTMFMAKSMLFPDLVEEMGLSILAPRAVSEKDHASLRDMNASGSLTLEDPVENLPCHRHNMIKSSLNVVFVYSEAVPAFCAVAKNVSMNIQRRADLDGMVSSTLQLSDFKDSVFESGNDLRYFVVLFLGSDDYRNEETVKNVFRVLSVVPREKMFGAFFVNQWDSNFDCMNALKELAKDSNVAIAHLSMKKLQNSVPLLLYFTHLCVGENGKVQSDQAGSDTSGGPWELVDVLVECRHVCPGLSSNANLIMIPTQHPSITRSFGRDNIFEIIKTDKIVSAFLAPRTRQPDASAEPPPKRRRAMSDMQTLITNGDLEETAKKRLKVWKSEEIVQTAFRDVDLPISCNRNELRFYHMDMWLDFDFEDSIVYGKCVIKVAERNGAKVSCCVLDCSELAFRRVYDAETGNNLLFEVTPSKITIFKDPDAEKFPKAICLEYRTQPTCPSLLWCTDCNGSPCVITAASPMNNRAMFPCADSPTESMSYTAEITVPHGYYVAWTAPQVKSPVHVVKTYSATGKTTHHTTFFFKMDTMLPPCTIALSIGCYQSVEIEGAVVPSAIIGPPSLLKSAREEFAPLVTRFLPEMISLLGPFPYNRYDIAITPKAFPALGMQNSNLTFFSASMITGNQSMAQRVAHEMSHCFFGLLLSESDANEVWLSEGFAEYVSERIVFRSEKLSLFEQECRAQIASLLRLRVMINDLSNTPKFFHRMAQNISKDSADSDPQEYVQREMEARKTQRDTFSDPGIPQSTFETADALKLKQDVIVNCMAPVQHKIPYVKGYFLLRHLAYLVGIDAFDRFLKDYVAFFSDVLFTGRDMLNFFFSRFPEVRTAEHNTDTIIQEWIREEMIPPSVNQAIMRTLSFQFAENIGFKDVHPSLRFSQSNPFVSQVDTLLVRILGADALARTVPKNAIIPEFAGICEVIAKLSSDQTRLLLQRIIESTFLCHDSMVLLDELGKFWEMNVDIRHCWCEIILMNHAQELLPEVEKFILNERGMGLFLLGELLHSESQREHEIGKELCRKIQTYCDPLTHHEIGELQKIRRGPKGGRGRGSKPE